MGPATLIQLISGRKTLTKLGITFIEGSRQDSFLSYQDLYFTALKVLSFLQHEGLKPGEELVFQIEENKSFVLVFWACILGGIIPVPLTVGQNDDHKQKLFAVWPLLKKPRLICSPEQLQNLQRYSYAKGLPSLADVEANVIDVSNILSSSVDGEVYEADESETAFVQFSSGSTGQPKGVILTHKNLLANMDAISSAAQYSPSDSLISWMPLTHDMGLIGFHLNPLFSGVRQYIIPTSLFIRNPAIWLDTVSQYRATVLCSPNFGYQYLIKHANIHLKDRFWDLSCVRILYNGAEPISVALCAEFLNVFSKYGLRENAMCPVYGLAEASLAVSMSGLNDEVISLDLNRNKLNIGDTISTAALSHHIVSFVNVGKPINYCSIQIANEKNEIVPEEVIGHIQIKGVNVTSGYYNNPEETKKTITHNGWLRTGDIGFFKKQCLYVTGRRKDIIFVNGQNYYPHDLERIAEEVEGIELNKIVIAGSFNQHAGRDEIMAFVVHRTSLEKFLPLKTSLQAHINLKVGINLDRVLPVKEIPKTTSGKLQRYKLIEKYRLGGFELVENELLKAAEQKSNASLDKPSNETETRLLELWRRILNRHIIGVTQKFFEIGGNSLTAAELSMTILKEFQVEVNVNKIYEKQTVRELSSEIASLSNCQYVPIPKADDALYHPVSMAQKRVYYACEIDKSSIAYNIPVAFHIAGSIDVAKLERSIELIIQRHDSLRMSFHLNGDVKFKVSNQVKFSLDHLTCSKDERDQLLPRLVRAFDLALCPLFRISLISIDDGSHVLFTDFHHIISDGLSMNYFLKELLQLYHGQDIEDLTMRYRDFAHWEVNFHRSPEVISQGSYWAGHLGGELPILDMPLDFQRPAVFNTTGGRIKLNLEKALILRLRAFSKRHNCTLHSFILLAYHLLLSKYSGQEDIVIGVPVAGRRHPDVLQMQGMFVNNLAIRNHLPGNLSVLEALHIVSQNVNVGLENQDYAFNNLINLLKERRDVSRNVVFDTMLIYQNIGFPKIPQGEFEFQRIFFDPGFSKYDLSLEVFEDNELIQCEFEYATSLFSNETVTRLAGHFKNLLGQLITNPKQKVSEVTLLSELEYDRDIMKFNATERKYPFDKTIQQLFDDQVNATPENIAIFFEHDKITYKQLFGEVNKISCGLINNEVCPGDLVAIHISRSPDLIALMLAVLKVGGCYLPIDLDLPNERVNFYIADSKCKFVITENRESRQGRNESQAKFISIEHLKESSSLLCETKIEKKGSSLAYSLYTSGTTGRPKAVMVTHQSLVNYICFAAENYVKEYSIFPFYTSVSFDLTITSIFTPLITGSSIIIYRESGNDVIERVVQDEKADVIKLTPSHLRLLADNCTASANLKGRIKRFVVGGEQLETSLAAKILMIFGNSVEIINEYGPTEATVGCMVYKYKPDEDQGTVVPIGTPASNTQIYILDKHLCPVPMGVPGELYIAGIGLARGYLDNPVLTREKFVTNPFHKDEVMYKTGDIAKRLVNGMIEYIGRTDRQVKIKGHRIELSEIENQLVQFVSVTEAIVVVKLNKDQQKSLYAYYKSDIPIDEAKLKSHLLTKLPYYMMPHHFIRMQAMPLTGNGKIDLASLPEPNSSNDRKGTLPNHTEQKLIGVWQEVLGNDNIQGSDNFFDLGGDSIKAVQIASRLLEAGIILNVKDILTYQTISHISPHIGTAVMRIFKQEICEGLIGFTPIQSWFFGQGFENAGHYNQTLVLKFNERINPQLLKKTFKQLIAYHDSLRVNYDRSRNSLFYNNEHLTKDIAIEECNVTGQAKFSLTEPTVETGKVFDLENDLLIRLLIFKNEEFDFLQIVIHHLIIDGFSWRILLSDLRTLYTKENILFTELPKKTLSLKEWGMKISEYYNSEALKREIGYWKGVDAVHFVIPQDFSTDEWKVKYSRKVTATLEKQRTDALLKHAYRIYKVDIGVLLNTAIVLSLHDWTGLDVFVVEQENFGRQLDDIGTARTLGWFTALHPSRLELLGNTIDDKIKNIKEQIRNIPNHGIGYGVLNYLPASNLKKKSLSEIRVNYLGQFEDEFNNDLFSLLDQNYGLDASFSNAMTAKLEINAIVTKGKMNLEIVYNNKAHRASTIRWFMDSILKHLDQISTHLENGSTVHFTPSDFDADVDQEDIDALFV